MTEPTSRAAVQADLDAWWAALRALATGQSYTIAGRQLTRADEPSVRSQIAYLTRIRDSFVDAARVDPPTAGGFKVAAWSGTTT